MGESGLILVQNIAFGGPELLPFDLRQKRVLTYDSPPDAKTRAIAKQKLKSALRAAPELILQQEAHEPAHPIDLDIGFEEKRIDARQHEYQLQVRFKNVSTRQIDQWHVDLQFPTRLLKPNVSHMLRVPSRSDQERTLFRASQENHRVVVYPGDTQLAMTLGYQVDEAIFKNHQGLLDESAIAIAYVNGEECARAERVVRELQNF